MTTILTAASSDGVRRCDAACHYARGARCDCCCEGRFHGRGVDGTLAGEVAQVAVEWLVYLETQGVDTTEVARLRERGTEKLEDERRAWLATRRRTRGRRARQERRRGKRLEACQGLLAFGPQRATSKPPERAREDGSDEEIEAGVVLASRDGGEGRVGAQDGPIGG